VEESMDDDGFSVVEWADSIPGLIPDGAIWIELRPTAESTRRILLKGCLPTRAIDEWRLR
jgi:tRNA A37 threonylcarbamoyladenosine biosynthesis protein TsaE